MSELELRYKQALNAVRELLSVRSAPAEAVREQLQALVEETEVMIDMLSSDIASADVDES